MEIKKREVIVSVVIVAVMFVLGFLISGKVTDAQNDKNAEYYKAIHIDNTDLFVYGMNTNTGNAFIYGDLKSVDPVSFDKIDGQYMYIKKVEEHYNRHTRTVTKTKTVNGKTRTYTDTEVYYSWDYHDSWEKHSEKISFCGVEFDYGKVVTPGSYHLDTIKESSRVRHVYYVVDAQHTGTIYTNLFDGTISDNSKFFKDTSIEESLERCTANYPIVIFWVLWGILTCGLVVGFYYLENRWLD